MGVCNHLAQSQAPESNLRHEATILICRVHKLQHDLDVLDDVFPMSNGDGKCEWSGCDDPGQIVGRGGCKIVASGRPRMAPAEGRAQWQNRIGLGL